eukprot:TRINITY_DN379_c0_g2_i1.p1 TRINITY_DN379_c0_g2~~TRINITY_DN379_c0_g2_i1.p1  ORF type:complete len:121 (-),score=44.00 TRINITY_DN379_c0_g2_i1:114-476(-)
MLRPKVLPKILEQVNTNGVKMALLISLKGELIASSSIQIDSIQSRAVAALVSNLWTTYQHQTENLTQLLFDCDEGNVVVLKITNVLICVLGNKSAEFGMLRCKAQAICDHIKGPFEQLQL